MLRSNLHLTWLAFFAWFTLTSAKVRYFSQDDLGKEGPVGSDSDTSTFNRKPRSHAAILVAGSRGYRNYRHQADMCHAYQMLKKKGMSSHNIIVFIYDDIARSSSNPYPGKIYNVPDGYDVYPGCAKDYTGSNVNKSVLMAVLRGDAKAVKGIGSGRVLSKKKNQRVFFAYSGFGSIGDIALPTGPSLYADEFNKLLIELKEKKVFGKMMVYIESSFAGSMFNGMPIAKKKKILGVTAAVPGEGSYATYCPSYQKNYTQTINPNKIGSCMADLFSVSWILDGETHDIFQTKVFQHLDRVTNATSVGGTYRHGSHVTAYGDRKQIIRKGKLADFFSGESAGKMNPFDSIGGGLNADAQGENYKQTDADLVQLYLEASKNSNSEAALELEKELAMRRHTDDVIYSSLYSLVESGVLPTDTPVSKFVEVVIARGKDGPVVSDWDCLRGMVDAWEDKCGRLNSYSGQYSRAFANLCNAKVAPAAFKESIKCQQSVYDEWSTQ